MGYPDPWPLLERWQVPLLALAIFGSGALLIARACTELHEWRNE